MLRWLKRQFGFRDDGDRAIFRYHTGYAWRYADPFVIQRGLVKHGGDNWQVLLIGLTPAGGVPLGKLSPSLRAAAVATYHAAVERVAALVREAFGVMAFSSTPDGRQIGLTDAECLNLLASYLDFINELEEEFRPLPMPLADLPQSQEEAIEPCAESPSIENDSEPSLPATCPEAFFSPSTN